MKAAVELWGERGEMTWLVRLGMLTGARLEELCQLSRDNIRDVGGILAFVIDDGRFVDDDGKTYRRRIKNDPSKRIVPVHSSLIAAGFVKFAEGQSVRLFPSFRRSSGRYGHNPSKAFHRLLHDQIGFVDEFGKRDKRVRFHSLRHTLITALHNASVPQVQVNAIVGHERARGAAGGYIDELALPLLKDAIEKVTLP
jgi:integrase